MEIKAEVFLTEDTVDKCTAAVDYKFSKCTAARPRGIYRIIRYFGRFAKTDGTYTVFAYIRHLYGILMSFGDSCCAKCDLYGF